RQTLRGVVRHLSGDRIMFTRHLVKALLLVVASGGFLAAQEERSQRGFLGIAVGSDGEEKGGLRIRDVVRDSAAAKAGLKTGDVLLKLNDQKLTDGESFFRLMAGKKSGDKVSCVI